MTAAAAAPKVVDRAQSSRPADEPPPRERDDAKKDEELRCTLCGLRACWTK
jgi:hypothetical protein